MTITDYLRIVQSNYTKDHCGVDLSEFGSPFSEEVFNVTDNDGYKVDVQDYQERLKGIEEFLKMMYTSMDVRPFWIRINVIDQVLNDYVGMGFLNRFSDWSYYILSYLLSDEAEQGGDCIFVIFDLEFEWAISMIFSQEEKNLKIKLHKK